MYPGKIYENKKAEIVSEEEKSERRLFGTYHHDTGRSSGLVAEVSSGGESLGNERNENGHCDLKRRREGGRQVRRTLFDECERNKLTSKQLRNNGLVAARVN